MRKVNPKTNELASNRSKGRAKEVLAIDIGGSGIKVFATGRDKAVEIPSGRGLTPSRFVSAVKRVTAQWDYGVVSIGYPGRVEHNLPVAEAPNLGSGWKGFDFSKTFRCPVKVMNDAEMQALGSYKGGRMLFLGLGTGLGSALILDGVVHATQLGDLPYRNGRSYGEYLSQESLEKMGRPQWIRHARKALKQLKNALQVDYVVLGGGKEDLVPNLPSGVLLGDNSKAFVGAVLAWENSTHL